MLAAYLRILLLLAALVGAVVLFLFAFTTAAIVVAVLVLIGLIFGRGQGPKVWVFRREPGRAGEPRPRGPITIDHDPNDLPPPSGPSPGAPPDPRNPQP